MQKNAKFFLFAVKQERLNCTLGAGYTLGAVQVYKSEFLALQ
jgi:hypothetical protein